MEAPEDASCAEMAEGEPPVRGHFYSVYVPPDVRQKGTEARSYIYKDKVEAMKMVRKTKKARFKPFEYFRDALQFATTGELDAPRSPQELNGGIKGVQFNAQIVGERLSPFKGPKPQDLVKLRKAIEMGDLEGFRQAVWENPRYLVSSGDTPSILQEGFRYNALHVAARAKNGPIAELILSTISDPKFVTLLYGEDLNENVENRIQVLLDLYLNTPDKGANETPLHFASKLGSLEVVEVLVSFAQCDKTLKNKYGQTADMIICDRCPSKNEALRKKIAMHLENCYYVPVLRAEDGTVAPIVGEPFSPDAPTVLSQDPLSPRLEIHAFAGPMNKERADHFRKVWKTPPRTSTPLKNNNKRLDSIQSLRFTDPAKGLERLGQTLANKFDVSWKEYWSFLDSFLDFSSDECLVLLEKYLKDKIHLVENSAPGTPEDSRRNLSSIADLCLQMQNCQLTDDFDDDFNAFLCVEKAVNVFANRISSDIYHKIFEDSLERSSLELQVKQLELLILSYMDDYRFYKVNFAQLHPRLGLLISQKMCYFIEKSYRSECAKALNAFAMECSKDLDCFSSDDEGHYSKDNKPTSSKKQLVCLIQNVLSSFNQDTEPKFELDEEEVCKEAWTKTKECNCVFHIKRVRKGLGLSRSNSSKYSYKMGLKSRRAIFTKTDVIEDRSSDEEYFTPPTSPHFSDDEEDFQEPPPLPQIFIQDSNPTKTDCDLFKALQYSKCEISPTKYPNLYRWYHNVNLYTESERESWPRPKSEATPTKATPSTPSSNSWMRITGGNTPRSNNKIKSGNRKLLNFY